MKAVIFLATASATLMAACGGDGDTTVDTAAESEPALCGINYPTVPNGQRNVVTLVAKPGLDYSTVAVAGSGFSSAQVYDLNIIAEDITKGLTVGPFSERGAVCIKNPEKPPKKDDTVITYLGNYTYLIGFQGRVDRDKQKVYVLEAYNLDTKDAASKAAMSAHFSIDPARYPTAKLDSENLDICQAYYTLGRWIVGCSPAEVTQSADRLVIQSPLTKGLFPSTWVFLVSTQPRGG